LPVTGLIEFASRPDLPLLVRLFKLEWKVQIVVSFKLEPKQKRPGSVKKIDL
jgi:hypothetical protein